MGWGGRCAGTLKRPSAPSAAMMERKARKFPLNGNTPGCRPRWVAAETYTQVKGATVTACTASRMWARALLRLMRPRSCWSSLRSGRTCSDGHGRGTAMRHTKFATVSSSGCSISDEAALRAASGGDPRCSQRLRTQVAGASRGDASAHSATGNPTPYTLAERVLAGKGFDRQRGQVQGWLGY